MRPRTAPEGRFPAPTMMPLSTVCRPQQGTDRGAAAARGAATPAERPVRPRRPALQHPAATALLPAPPRRTTRRWRIALGAGERRQSAASMLLFHGLAAATSA